MYAMYVYCQKIGHQGNDMHNEGSISLSLFSLRLMVVLLLLLPSPRTLSGYSHCSRCVSHYLCHLFVKIREEEKKKLNNKPKTKEKSADNF